MMISLPFQTSVPSADRRGFMYFSRHHNRPGTTCGNQSRFLALSPEMRVLGVLGRQRHSEKHHSLRTLSKGPTETGFFTLQLPHQGFEAATRHSPKETHGHFKQAERRGLSISQPVPCGRAMAYFAVGPQPRLIKKRSVGPLELITNHFCQCHTQPCLGKCAGVPAKWKGFEV